MRAAATGRDDSFKFSSKQTQPYCVVNDRNPKCNGRKSGEPRGSAKAEQETIGWRRTTTFIYKQLPLLLDCANAK